MRVLPLIGLFLLCACGPSIQGEGEEADVTLRAEPATVSPGDTVELILTNGSAATVSYNLCSSGLEGRAGSAWEAVPSDRMCTMELRRLPPGGATRYPIPLPAGLPGGEYRFVTTVHDEATASVSTLRSGTVRVEG